MKKLHARLTKAARARRSLPTLSQAILGERGMAYARHRIGFALLRSLLSAGLHAIEALVLSIALDSPYLIAILATRVVAGAVSSLVWGGTEALRQDLRDLLRASELPAAKIRLEDAIARAIVIGSVCVVAGIVSAFFFPFLGRGIMSVVDAYGLAIAIRVALSFVSRTYSSGVNAVARIYRSRLSMIIPDLLDFAGLFLFWRFVGPWSIVLSLLLSSLAQFAFAMHYARRSYKGFTYAPRTLSFRRAFGLQKGLILRWCQFVVAGLGFEMHSWALVGFWSSVGTTEAGMLFYALRPIASFLLTVPRIYYIDFVELRVFGHMMMWRFVHHMRRVMGGVFLLIVALIAASTFFVDEVGAPDLAFLFVVFTFTAGAFSLYALRDIVRARARLPVAFSFLLVGAIAACRVMHAPVSVVLLLSSLLLAGAAIAMHMEQRTESWLPRRATDALPLPAWLARVAARPGTTRVFLFRVPVEAPKRVTRTLAKLLAEEFPRADVTELGRRMILTCDRAEESDRETWTRHARGTASLELVFDAKNGHEMLRALIASQVLAEFLGTPLASAQQNAASLCRWIAANVEEATVLQKNALVARGSVGSMAELRGSLPLLIGGHVPPQNVFGDYEVSVFAPRGVIERLVLCPRTVAPEKRQRLRNECWKASMAASIEGQTNA